MRMSGLSKVEMSGFIGGRGAHGDGADYLEPTRTGPAAVCEEDASTDPNDLADLIRRFPRVVVKHLGVSTETFSQSLRAPRNRFLGPSPLICSSFLSQNPYESTLP
jgi:hypothetical protein